MHQFISSLCTIVDNGSMDVTDDLFSFPYTKKGTEQKIQNFCNKKMTNAIPEHILSIMKKIGTKGNFRAI